MFEIFSIKMMNIGEVQIKILCFINLSIQLVEELS